MFGHHAFDAMPMSAFDLGTRVIPIHLFLLSVV